MTCGTSPPERPSPGTSRQQERPAVALSDLQFSDAEVQAKFRRFDAAAKALAKPDWNVRPYRNMSYSGGPARFVATWCQRIDRRGECDCSPQAARPNHWIGLVGQTHRGSGDRIEG